MIDKQNSCLESSRICSIYYNSIIFVSMKYINQQEDNVETMSHLYVVATDKKKKKKKRAVSYSHSSH